MKGHRGISTELRLGSWQSTDEFVRRGYQRNGLTIIRLRLG